MKGLKIGGLKTAELTPVPGVISPTKSNSATPNMVGAQATVKMPKPKKPGQATDKPSKFFKSEDFGAIKRPSIENLRVFLERQRAKKSIK